MHNCTTSVYSRRRCCIGLLLLLLRWLSATHGSVVEGLVVLVWGSVGWRAGVTDDAAAPDC